MKRSRLSITVIFLIIWALNSSAGAEKQQWTDYYVNDLVSEFYKPDSLKVINEVSGGKRIEVWTKTEYSPAGAKAIIKYYGLEGIIDPENLKYRIAKINIRPHTREIAWQGETFYDDNDRKIWVSVKTAKDLSWQTVRPDSIEERYFCFFLDRIIHPQYNIYLDFWNDGQKRWIGMGYDRKDDKYTKIMWLDSLSVLTAKGTIDVWLQEGDFYDQKRIETRYFHYIMDTYGHRMRFCQVYILDDNGKWLEESINTGWRRPKPGTNGEFWYNKVCQYVKQNENEIREHMFIKPSS